jgi:hypothetical protein
MALGLCISFLDLSTHRNIEQTPTRIVKPLLAVLELAAHFETDDSVLLYDLRQPV